MSCVLSTIITGSYSYPHNNTSLRKLKVLQRTPDSSQPLMEHVRENHRRPHVTAPEQLLNRAAAENLLRCKRALKACMYGTHEGTTPAGCSKSSSSEAAGESKPEAYPQGYVEDFDEPRTKQAGFFSILLNRILEDRFCSNRLSQHSTTLELLKNPSSRRIEICRA